MRISPLDLYLDRFLENITARDGVGWNDIFGYETADVGEDDSLSKPKLTC